MPVRSLAELYAVAYRIEADAVERYELPRDEAIAYFKSIGEAYKAEIIESIPAGEVLSLYRQGDFTDLRTALRIGMQMIAGALQPRR